MLCHDLSSLARLSTLADRQQATQLLPFWCEKFLCAEWQHSGPSQGLSNDDIWGAFQTDGNWWCPGHRVQEFSELDPTEVAG